MQFTNSILQLSSPTQKMSTEQISLVDDEMHPTHTPKRSIDDIDNQQLTLKRTHYNTPSTTSPRKSIDTAEHAIHKIMTTVDL